MQNNNGVVNVRSSLTKVGKKRASENRFNVTKVAFADDGINYNLLSINLPQKDLAVSRTPLFDVWKNSENVLQNKILIFPDGIPILPSEYNFNIQMDIQGENRKRSVATVRADVNFPEFVRRQGVSKRIMYYNTSPVESAQMQDVIVGFSPQSAQSARRLRNLTVRKRLVIPSKRSICLLRGWPRPDAILITSSAWMHPMTPGMTPKTPPSEQFVTVLAGGGDGNKQR